MALYAMHSRLIRRSMPLRLRTRYSSSDQNVLLSSPEPEVGDVLEIEYDGSIAESYPAQITNVHSISVVE